MPSPSEITVPQLARLIGTPSSPVILDVRIDEDFALDPDYIPTAFRHPFKQVEQLVDRLQSHHVVVYCQKGKKISQGAGAILKSCGIKAETLEGGHFAWRDKGQPLVPDSKLSPLFRNGSDRTVWVTRHRPKIDRIACPWLIKRFVDPNARFLFVSPSEVLDVAEKFDAIPFDVEDIHFSHRGDACTFDTMIEEFGLCTPELLHLATIVRGADTNRHDLSAQSAGLLAASLGFSRMYRDDLQQLDASLPLYDAFYRWCRDATNENHDWPTNSGGK